MANILHAQDNPISQAIAAWPPLALLLTVELISRVPVLRRSLAFARFAATATIAGIAAWVSYWHMAGVAARYGESGASAYLLPVSVDGLIVVASISLVELGGRISAVQSQPVAPASAPVAASDAIKAALGAVRAALPQSAGGGTPGAADAPPPAKSARAPASKAAGRKPAKAATPRPRRPVAETAALAAAIEAARPNATEDEVAEELGISVARLRTIRRQTRELEPAA
jgi:hypothetical protein